MDERIVKLNQVIRGWINYFRSANMKGNMKMIGRHLRHRVRCVIWKQWKTSQNRMKCLMKLGIDKDTAKSCSYSRKSYWQTSHCIPVDKAISNDRLKRKGLVFPLDHYLKVHTVI